MSYIPSAKGFVNLTTVDSSSRRALAHRVASKQESRYAVAA